MILKCHYCGVVMFARPEFGFEHSSPSRQSAGGFKWALRHLEVNEDGPGLCEGGQFVSLNQAVDRKYPVLPSGQSMT